MQSTVYTIGHSTHPQAELISLLRKHGVTAVSDVRSKPYSHTNPQFNRQNLKAALRKEGILYVFLGKELGARSDDPSCYENGKVRYDRLAKTQLFHDGIARITNGMQEHRIALMCAEKEPLQCHRTILVARYLVTAGAVVQHIHADGHLESQRDALKRLMSQLGMRDLHMFRSQDDLEREAYERQEERIAYSVNSADRYQTYLNSQVTA